MLILDTDPMFDVLLIQCTQAEHKAAAESGAGSVVGWLTRGHYAGWVVYLSVGPGIVGHTGFNTLLRYLTPLTVSWQEYFIMVPALQLQ